MPFWTSATHRAVSCNWPSRLIAASMLSPHVSKMSARTYGMGSASEKVVGESIRTEHDRDAV